MNETEQLLRDYVEGGSDTAFHEIVARYVNFVFSAALRLAGGDAHRADDIVQTVFSDLARKASSLPRDVMLGGWLHRHCCFVARNVLRSEARREARERAAMDLMQLNRPSPEPGWDALVPIIDDAIQALDQSDREAITLRYLEQRDLRSVGTLLGTSEDAAQKRVSRALQRLRDLVAQRGVAVSLTALGALLTANSVVAAPEGCAARISGIALEHTASNLGFMASLAALLSTGPLKVAFAVFTVGIAITSVVLVRRAGPGQAASPVAAPVALPARAMVPAASATQPSAISAVAPGAGGFASDTNSFVLTVLSGETGEPIPRGRVEMLGWKDKLQRASFETDDSGQARIPKPRDALVRLDITTEIPGFADTRLQWFPAQGELLPDAYTVRVPKAVPIGGSVLTERGEAIPHAKVGFNAHDSAERAAAFESHNFGWIEVETDEAGRWTIDRIGADVLRTIYGGARHPDYTGSQSVDLARDAVAERELREQRHIFRLGDAVTVHGFVLDKDRNAVSGASVLVGPLGDSNSRQTTAALDGSFEIRGVKPGTNLITAEAPAFAPATLRLMMESNSPPVQIVLRPGHILRLRVVTKTGEPIPDANVWLDTLDRSPDGGVHSVQAEFSPKTDREGRIFWDQAPGGDLGFSIAHRGYMRRNDIKLQADNTEHTVVLNPGLRIHGTVTDSDTHQPIPTFKIIAGWPNNSPFGDKPVPHWSDIERYTLRFPQGKFDYTWDEPVIYGASGIEFMFKIAAEGYAAYITRVVDASEEDVTLNVELKPAHTARFVVLNPGGQPAAHAEVMFAGPLQQVSVGENGFSDLFSGPLAKSADEKGQLTWDPDESVTMIYAANQNGFAQLSPASLSENPAIQLRAWGRIDGVWLRRGQPATGKKLAVSAPREGRDPRLPNLQIQAQPTVDPDGRFEFAKVPPAALTLNVLEPAGERSFSFVPVKELTINAGETTSVDLSENGPDVLASVVLPSGMTLDRADQVFAVLHSPLPQPSQETFKDPQALARWRQSPEVRAAFRAAKHWRMEPTPDGRYKAEAIPAGAYVLDVGITPSTSGGAVLSARTNIDIAENESEATVDLGQIVLEPH